MVKCFTFITFCSSIMLCPLLVVVLVFGTAHILPHYSGGCKWGVKRKWRNFSFRQCQKQVSLAIHPERYSL